MATQEELDALDEMDRLYEEEERRKKAEKKGRKKGGKDADGKLAEETDQKLNLNDGEAKTDGSDKKTDKKSKKDKKPAAAKETPEPEDKAKSEDAPAAEAKKESEVKKEPETASSAASKKNKKSDSKTKEAEKSKEAEKKQEAGSEKAEEPKEAKESKDKKSGKDAKGATKKKAGPGVSALKEALAKVKEQEEAMQREEEEKQRREEEARQKIIEKERLEKEKKEKKKQKEKERIARLKQEGKFETKEQKEKKMRALMQLEALGVKIPAKTAEEEAAAAQAAAEVQLKKPKYGRLRKSKQQNQTDEQKKEESPEDEEDNEENEEASAEPEVKDSWEDVKDAWDAESDSSEKTKASSKKSKSSSKSAASASTTTSSGYHSTSATPSATSDNNKKNAASEEDESESEDVTDTDISDSESEDEFDKQNAGLPPVEKARLRIQRRHDEAEKNRNTDNLRAPVICVLGHVDTGKTKILDNLRRTRVQEDEAGGITQQIGATNVPLETLHERTKMSKHLYKNLIKIPGLLIIDTPGHESFKSLRTRGSSLCDIAILVIDIMHGLEPQTIESINILKDKKTPFLVALNKIDRLFDWKTAPNKDVVQVLEEQPDNTKREFEKRSSDIIVQLAEQGLNAALYYKNPDQKTYISLVPTSAHTSDGIGNLMALIIEFTQTILAKRVSYSDELQCTVMEVKAISGLGTTIDVCLVNGKLRLTDTVVIPGQEGPIVTQIRGLLLPQPNRELRVKNSYVMNKEVMGAQGVKIAAKELEKAMAGLPMFVARKDDEVEYYKEELNAMLKQVLSSIKLSDTGVFVQASTLGSLEALIDFLKSSKIPFAGISIGPVHKKDVTMASIMLEKDPQYAVILAFDVKVERDAQDMADHVGVKIFTADIIYHLFDKFMGYRDELKAKKREEFKDVAVFPFKIKIIPEFIFNTRDPIIVGVKIEAGFLKIGSPVCAMCVDPSAEREGKDKFVDLGRISSIEYNHKPLEVAKQGQEVCIKIDNTTGGAPKLLGRHFLATDFLVSKISRESIDAVKNYFREEMTKSDWQLIIELKKQFQIL